MPKQPDFPRRMRARAMGAVMSAAESSIDDGRLAAKVREIVKALRDEERAFRERETGQKANTAD